MWLVALIMSARTQCSLGLAGLSRMAIGVAIAMMTSVDGTRMATDQVSMAEVVWPT